MIPLLNRRQFALEMIFQSKFDNARRTDHTGDLSEGARGRRKRPIRWVKAGMVCEVEEFAPEIEIMTFRNVKLLSNAKIPVEISRSADGSDTGAAECSERLLLESNRAGETRAYRVERVVNVAIG